MNNELMIMSMYDKLKTTINKVCQELKCDYTLFDCENISDDLIYNLEEYFKSNSKPDVIIGRGGVAEFLQKTFTDIAILRAEPDDIDIVEALYKAKKYGENIGLLIYKNNAFYSKLDFLRNLLNLNTLKIYDFESCEDITSQITQARKDGMDAVIGGGTLGQSFGKTIGYPVMFVETSERIIRNVVLQANTIIEARRNEKKQLQNLQAVMDSVQEGIMVIRNNIVQILNPELEKILQSNKHNICGRHINTLSAYEIDSEIINFITSESISENVLEINENYYLFKKIRLSSKIISNDIMIIAHHSKDIRNKELTIRTNLLNARGMIAKYNFSNIIGVSSEITDAIGKAKAYANVDTNLLISGESGSGKELFAQSIHNSSKRRNHPFVAVNCAAIPESLLESEFFGYEEGSFSGSKKGGKMGLFELAHKGTLFLDEINSLSMDAQGVLLRAIQEKEIWRIGSYNSIAVDIRVISTTNLNIISLIENKQFRADLYFRLNTLNLHIPSLGDRRADIPLYVDYFLDMYSKMYNYKAKKLPAKELQILMSRRWHGNVRELQNVIHRYVILNSIKDETIENCFDDTSFTSLLPNYSANELLNTLDDKNTVLINKGFLKDMESQLIQHYLNENHWNYQQTADNLGICRTTLWRKLKEK